MIKQNLFKVNFSSQKRQQYSMPWFFAGAHQVDKCLNFRRSDVLLQ